MYPELVQFDILLPFPSPLQGGSKRRVADLFEDLKDGLILMDLMKIFTDEDLVSEGTSFTCCPTRYNDICLFSMQTCFLCASVGYYYCFTWEPL